MQPVTSSIHSSSHKSAARFRKCLSALRSSNIDQETFVLTCCLPQEYSVLSDLHMSCCPWAFTPQRHKGLLIERYQFTEGFMLPTRNIRYQTSHVIVVKLTIITGIILENCCNKECSLELSTCIK